MSFVRLTALAAASVACFASTRALAVEDHYSVEISGSTTAAFALTTGSDSRNTFIMETQVAAPITEPDFDIALDLSFATSDRTGPRTTEFAFIPGFQFNFGAENVRSAFFLFGGAGFDLASQAGTTDTEFTFRFRLGKRFSLSQSVSYAPDIEFTKTNSLDGVLTFVPFSFSVFL